MTNIGRRGILPIRISISNTMVHFVGAGPGAPDLITLRGAQLLQQADCIIYAGSLVNPALLALAKDGCSIYNSAEMILEEVLTVFQEQERQHHETVRLHTGDASIYGAIREQMDALERLDIAYDDTPGVSSFCGAAAALGAEYTLPGISQTVIITRMAGRTPVPEREALASLAAHGASDGDFPVGRYAASRAGCTSAGSVYRKNTGGAGVQGNLAGGKGGALHAGRTGAACGAAHQITKRR